MHDAKITPDSHDDRFLEVILESLAGLEVGEDQLNRLGEQIPELLEQSAESLLKELKASAPSMLEEHLSLRLGFEGRLREVWGKALDLLEMLLVMAAEAGEEFNKEFRAEAAQQQDFVFDVLTRLHARACQVGYEILTLLKAGFADGAHARWRTLHEIAVVAFFVREHGRDVAERYLLYDAVDSYRNARQYQSHCQALHEEPFTDGEMAEMKARHDALLARFGRDYGSFYGWAAAALEVRKPTFARIERSTHLDHWRPYYSMASYNVHAESRGITFKLGLSPANRDSLLLAGASDAGLADPGQGAAIALHQVTVAALLIKPNLDRLMILTAMQQLVDEIGQAFLDAHCQVEERTLQLSGSEQTTDEAPTVEDS